MLERHIVCIVGVVERLLLRDRSGLVRGRVSPQLVTFATCTVFRDSTQILIMTVSDILWRFFGRGHKWRYSFSLAERSGVTLLTRKGAVEAASVLGIFLLLLGEHFLNFDGG